MSLTDDLLADLWEAMAEIFLHRWTGTVGDSPTRVWRVALEDLSVQEVARGIAYCIKHPMEWPPTPGMFRSFCRPALDYERAFLIAAEQVSRRRSELPQAWVVPDAGIAAKCLFWAASGMASDMLMLPFEKLRARWKAALDHAIANEAELSEIPAMAQRISRRSAGVTDAGENALAYLRKRLGMSRAAV